MRKLIILTSAIVLSACTDGARAKIGAFGEKGNVTCYSGGQVIYKGRSSGKIQTEKGSDGWFFQDDSSGKLVRLSGDCVIVN